MNCGQHNFLKGLLFLSQSLTFMSEIESENPHDTVSNNVGFNCNGHNGTVENTPEALTSTIIFGIVIWYFCQTTMCHVIIEMLSRILMNS